MEPTIKTAWLPNGTRGKSSKTVEFFQKDAFDIFSSYFKYTLGTVRALFGSKVTPSKHVALMMDLWPFTYSITKAADLRVKWNAIFKQERDEEVSFYRVVGTSLHTIPDSMDDIYRLDINVLGTKVSCALYQKWYSSKAVVEITLPGERYPEDLKVKEEFDDLDQATASFLRFAEIIVDEYILKDFQTA